MIPQTADMKPSFQFSNNQHTCAQIAFLPPPNVFIYEFEKSHPQKKIFEHDRKAQLKTQLGALHLLQ